VSNISYPSKDDRMGNLADAHKRIDKALDQIRLERERLATYPDKNSVLRQDVFRILDGIEQALTGGTDVEKN
jgi:hypothetical protein